MKILALHFINCYRKKTPLFCGAKFIKSKKYFFLHNHNDLHNSRILKITVLQIWQRYIFLFIHQLWCFENSFFPNNFNLNNLGRLFIWKNFEACKRGEYCSIVRLIFNFEIGSFLGFNF